MNSQGFVSLHNHSDYSMLDGLAKIPEWVRYAKELGMDALGLSDHGTISGLWEFYVECMKLGINPICGCEFYYVPDAAKARKKQSAADKSEKTTRRFHITIFARNAAGLQTLIRMLTEAHRQFYYKPLLDRAIIESLGDERDNLVVLSGCAASIISRKLMSDNPDAGYVEAKWWRKMFKHFYFEIMHHGTEMDHDLNPRILALAKKLHVPHAITNDGHYTHKKDHKHHDALLAIQTASDIDDPNRFAFDGSGYHLRSGLEIKKAFKSYDADVYRRGVRNTVKIAESCQIRIPEWDRKTWHIPKFPLLPEDTTSDKYLRKLAFQNLRSRGLDHKAAYTERVHAELAAIKKAGIADFLLITWEAINWAKGEGIWVGPGRGSVCGCLVAYLLGIHKMDSIRYKLMFERFLNPERPKAPDVDSDFEPDGRPRVIQHYIDLYGAENVMRVAAFQKMGVSASFQTLAKAHGMSPQERNRWTKELGVFEKRDSEDEEVDEEEDISILPEEIRDNYPGLANQMRHLLGTKKAISRHAGGVLIFEPTDPIKNYVGLQWLPNPSAPNKGNWAASYDLATVEGMMLMKQDTLGLRTLATIKECVRMIKENHDITLDVDEWNPDHERDDQKVYEMLAQGRCGGVFQMEGGSNSKGIVEIHPTEFEDIVACTALYRKGPIMAGAPDRFLKNRKDGKARVVHPSLKEFLGTTWGEMIYDEQMLDILVNLAGFSWARADDAKNAMKKKDPELMAPLRSEAIKGFQKIAGMSKKEAKTFWKIIEAQTAYLFNRSHAVAYSFTSYITARLKCFYPLEFMTALVRTVKADKTHMRKRIGYVGELAEMGVKILAPDINSGQAKATCGHIDHEAWFMFGFTDCKGIGDSKAKKLIDLRDSGDATGFFSIKDVKMDKTAMEVLNAVGAFRNIGGTKGKSRAKEEIIGWRFKDPMKKLRQKWAKKVVLPGENGKTVILVGEIVEIEKRKTKNDDPFVVWTIQWSPAHSYRITLFEDADEIWYLKRGSIVKVNGRWNTKFTNLAVSNADDQVLILKEVA